MLSFWGQSLLTERSPLHHKNEYINTDRKLLKLRMKSPLEEIMVPLRIVKPLHSVTRITYSDSYTQRIIVMFSLSLTVLRNSTWRSKEWLSVLTSACGHCAAKVWTWCSSGQEARLLLISDRFWGRDQCRKGQQSQSQMPWTLVELSELKSANPAIPDAACGHN